MQTSEHSSLSTALVYECSAIMLADIGVLCAQGWEGRGMGALRLRGIIHRFAWLIILPSID